MATAFVTALLAVLVFVFTQSFLKLVLEPIQEQKKLIGEVAHALLFYANVGPVGASEEERSRAREALRGLAGQLRASLWTIPFYDTLARMGRVPKREDLLEASTQLVGWSNSLNYEAHDRPERRKIIADRLGITEKVGIV
jgi:hypothetical protein